MLLIFADAEQARLWRAENPPAAEGHHFEVSQAQLAELSALFYGGRAAPTFSRRKEPEIRAVFARAGLTGPFWELPEH